MRRLTRFVAVAIPALVAAVTLPATAAQAKGDFSVHAAATTVAVGDTIRLSGTRTDDAGLDLQRVCLYEVTAANTYRPAAPCVGFTDEAGKPAFGQTGYYTIRLTATAPGRLVLVPFLEEDKQLDPDARQPPKLEGNGLPLYGVAITVNDRTPSPVPTAAHTNSGNTALVAALAGGAVVLLAAIAGFVFYRRRSSRRRLSTSNSAGTDRL